MKLVPILHRILVKPKQLAEANETYRKMSELGFVIPDVTDVKREQQAVEIGTVLAIGDTAYTGNFETETKPKVGDVVYFAKYSGKEVLINKEKHLLLNDEDVVAIVIGD